MVSKADIQYIRPVDNLGFHSDYHKTKSEDNLSEERTETIDYGTWDADVTVETEDASVANESACHL